VDVDCAEKKNLGWGARGQIFRDGLPATDGSNLVRSQSNPVSEEFHQLGILRRDQLHGRNDHNHQ
jgi:hypothetical protein